MCLADTALRGSGFIPCPGIIDALKPILHPKYAAPLRSLRIRPVSPVIIVGYRVLSGAEGVGMWAMVIRSEELLSTFTAMAGA